MKRHLKLITVALALPIIVTACGASAGAALPPTTSHGGPVKDYASLIDALRAAGLKVEIGDEVEQPFLAVKGRILKVDAADVQVVEYATEAAMQSDAAKIGADGSNMGTMMVDWLATPHFYKTGKLIVLYVGDDARLKQALAAVLGAQFAGRD